MFVSGEILNNTNPLEAAIYVTLCRMQNRHYDARKYHAKYIGKALLQRELTYKEVALFVKCLASLQDRFQCVQEKHPDFKRDLSVRIAVMDQPIKAMSRGLWYQLKAGKVDNFGVTDDALETLKQELRDAGLLVDDSPVYKEEDLPEDILI